MISFGVDICKWLTGCSILGLTMAEVSQHVPNINPRHGVASRPQN